MTLAAAHPFSQSAFAQAFGGDSAAYFIEQWKCAILQQPIGKTRFRDAAGCYPFSPMAADADVKGGLRDVASEGLVSIVLVTDPLAMPPLAKLEEAFDFVRPFKTHFIFDRALGPISYTRRNWREVRSARSALHIREVDPANHHADMGRLYANLVDAKDIHGAADFGAGFFQALTQLHGIRAVAAWREDRIVSMMLFVQHGQTVYSFLAGTSEEGRRFAAHYGLYAEAIETFSDVTVFNLGGVPGSDDDLSHGIAHAKAKLTNTRRQSYLCGSIFNQDAYDRLCEAHGTGPHEAFFPRYRAR